MTRSKIIIITTLVVLAIILSLLYFFYGNKNTQTQSVTPDGNVSTFPVYPIIPGEKPSTTENQFEIKTKEGNVPINNIYKLPDATPVSGDGVNFKKSTYYLMAYYPKQQGFIIAIMDPDLEKARKFAEEDFLSTLNITKDQACKLNVSMTVPSNVSDVASGGNYHLSFCPNGKPFPKQ
jgi:hypothetical protein